MELIMMGMDKQMRALQLHSTEMQMEMDMEPVIFKHKHAVLQQDM